MIIHQGLLLTLLLVYSADGESSLVCPANVNTFSIGYLNEYYYSCRNVGDIPVLERCPPGEVYWGAKEKCSEYFTENRDGELSAANGDLRTYTEPVLGRTVYLGCLYDAKKNEIMPGDSFWKDKTIEENKKTSPSLGSDLYFFAAQSTFDRFSHMDFEASLKLAFLGGLVSVEGSASYLKDSVETDNTVAIVMKAHYVTKSETIPSMTPKDYNDLCKLKGPTHVVTSVTYGMDAHFVFTKRAKSSESKEMVSGNLKIAVESIPGMSIEGQAKVHLNGSLKEIVQNVKVKLDGDFVLEKQPTTYVESIGVFKTLSTHLGEKPDFKNAAKMKMQLTPITRFCDETTALLVSISDNLLHSVTIMLDKMERTRLKAKTLSMADCVNNYLPLKKIINTFIDELDIFTLKIKGVLQDLLPKIRGGKASTSEKNLIELITNYTKSPFNYETSDSFLKTRNREIQMIDFILNPDKFKDSNVKVIDYEKAIDDKILFEKPWVLMLKFNILPDISILNEFLKGKTVDEDESWFNNAEAVAIMGEQFKRFMEFAAANKNLEKRGFLVVIHKANGPFVNIYAQKSGKILTINFPCPDLPLQPTPTSNTYNSISFTVTKPDNIWITHFDIKYWQFGTANFTIEKRYPFSNGNASIEVKDLSPNQIYQFSLKYVTEMGRSDAGPASSPVVTRPCSMPTNLKIKELSSTSISVSWDPPVHKGPGLEINSYKVTLAQDDNVVRSRTISGVRRATFNDLNVATTFAISIKALANAVRENQTTQVSDGYSESLPSWIRTVTEPDTPSQPSLHSISYHEATITWTPPSKIADGAIIYDYRVKYVRMNHFGNETMIGSNTVLSSLNKTSVTIKDLIQGTTYGISVKIITSLGNSDYSPCTIVKTHFKETELDHLHRSINEEVKNRVTELNKKLAVESTRVDRKFHAETTRVDDITSNVMTIMKQLATKTKSEIDAVLNIPTLKVNYYPDVAYSCGGTFQKDVVIRYPSHGTYSDKEHCVWNINTGMPTTVKLLQMDLETCCDYVDIYDDGRKVTSLNGHHLATIHSVKGIIRVDFHTDGSNHYTGFTLEITRDGKDAKRYYPDFGAKFINYGRPTSSVAVYRRNMPKTSSTQSDCLQLCHDKYLIDKTWNGIEFDYNGSNNDYVCTCYQKDNGQNDFHPERLFFRIA